MCACVRVFNSMVIFKIIVYLYVNKSLLFTPVIRNQKILAYPYILDQCVLNQGLDITFLVICSLLEHEKYYNLGQAD